MQKKIRLIARLDVKDTNLVKGIQLEGLRKLGDPNSFAKAYYEQGILLDAGCGDGYYTKAVTEALQAAGKAVHVYGVDIS